MTFMERSESEGVIKKLTRGSIIPHKSFHVEGQSEMVTKHVKTRKEFSLMQPEALFMLFPPSRSAVLPAALLVGHLPEVYQDPPSPQLTG